MFVCLISSSVSDLTWECIWLEEARRLFQRYILSSRQPSHGFAHSSPETHGTATSLQPGMQPCQISAPEQERPMCPDPLLPPSSAGLSLIPDPCARRCHCCWPEHPFLLLGVLTVLGTCIPLLEDAQELLWPELSLQLFPPCCRTKPSAVFRVNAGEIQERSSSEHFHPGLHGVSQKNAAVSGQDHFCKAGDRLFS